MRRHLRAALTIITATTALVMIATAAPAQAVWAPPSTGQLVDAAGVPNGCTVSVSVAKSLLAGNEQQGMGVLITITPTCPASANVHRLVDALTVQTVAADGTLTTTSSGQTAMLQNSVDPIVGSFPGQWFTPCGNPDVKGTHTYRVVARETAKVQPSWRDPHPFVGKAGAVATITC